MEVKEDNKGCNTFVHFYFLFNSLFYFLFNSINMSYYKEASTEGGG